MLKLVVGMKCDGGDGIMICCIIVMVREDELVLPYRNIVLMLLSRFADNAPSTLMFVVRKIL